MNDVNSPSLDSVKDGAPGNEIEITPEMIEEAVRIIRRYFDQPNDWLTRAIAEEILGIVEYVQR
jgi:hypothetical protein